MHAENCSEPRVVHRQRTDAPEVYAVAGGQVAMVSLTSPDRAADSDNEDAVAVIPIDDLRAVVAVADGAGGLPGGADASGIALEALVRQVASRPPEATVRSAILHAFDEATREVTALGTGAATTLAVAEIEGTTIRTYHAGDSLALVTGQRGKVRHQTVSHSPTGYAVEAGLLDEREALHHEERHMVSNLVGASDMRIEIGPQVRMKVRDTLLLGSDGLFDNVHVSEVVEVIRAGPLARAAARLGELARQRMLAPEPDHPSKLDDLTFVLFRPQAPRRRRAPAAHAA